MARKRSAKSWVELVLEGQYDCDAALEEHLWENYQGPLEVPSFSKVHLALCCFNMGERERILELADGPIAVAEVIEEFGLAPWLPLFDRREDAIFHKGDLVSYGDDACRVIGRREVTPFAIPRFDDWEVFVETLDGGTAGFVGESEVEPVENNEAAEV
jgi:hypothetical protein